MTHTLLEKLESLKSYIFEINKDEFATLVVLEDVIAIIEQTKKECEPYAYAVDGNLEQLLFFDKESAELASEINCGTVLSLYTTPPDQTALIRELSGTLERAAISKIGGGK